ncbi:barwin-like endoglucanase [Lindgomyces ingoldianus]|uniref:Barwin-like endoglucanase n=1 Tax=Lindgomyces ingoldianus TaxID=673940 RepID=A0ACB6R7H3_9PLEO|nr:barwin-like endoglucanase [Lindgomyces ingoldianus]KAF2474411.1 barwin-like endoglucanase [Lindgomyces ingoldianus]
MKSLLFMLPLFSLVASKHHPHSHSKRPCSQGTVTVTYTPTVTLIPISSDAAPISTPISDSSSALDDATTVVTSIIYVTPSPIPYFPNGTFNSSAPSGPTGPSTLSFVFASSAIEDASTAAPVETNIPTSEAVVIPSSSAAAVPSASPSSSSNPVTGTEGALSGTNSGEATFYGGNVAGGMCSFTGYTIPSGIYGTALSDSNWAGAGNCGACISVKGPDGNYIKAMIVDQCPGCGTNHLDLFPDAFSALAAPSKGVIPVSWSIVPCGITSPIVLKNKEGTSKYWFSIQVQNANVPVSKLEVSVDGGKTFAGTTRKDYNYFENASGFGVESVTVRVTSVTGGVVTVGNVGTTPSTTYTASGNFA